MFMYNEENTRNHSLVFQNVGFIDVGLRVVLTLVCLSMILLVYRYTHVSELLIFPLLSVYPAITAMMRWDPIYAGLRMHSMETDREIQTMLAIAKTNLVLRKLKWQRQWKQGLKKYVSEPIVQPVV